MVRMCLLIAAVSLAPLAELLGQAEPATALARLRTGQTLRIRLHDGQSLQARVASVDSEPRIVRSAAPDLAIPLSAIDSLWLKRHATKTGALVGAIVLGAGMGATVASYCSTGDECADGAWLAGAGIGAGAGALLGAGIGSLIPKWRLIHPSRATLSLRPARIGLSAVAQVRF